MNEQSVIGKIDYLLGALVGFLAGICVIPTAYNLGVHSAAKLLLLPWAVALVFAAGMWVAGVLALRMSFFTQFSKFVAVGFLNTAIDFGMLNLLSRISGVSAGFILGGVNIPGFIVAVSNSYFWNKLWVFQERNRGESLFQDFPKFFAVTAIGLLMNSAIVIAVTTYIPPVSGVSRALWLNLGKAGATVVTLIWNFAGYKFFVFRQKESL